MSTIDEKTLRNLRSSLSGLNDLLDPLFSEETMAIVEDLGGKAVKNTLTDEVIIPVGEAFLVIDRVSRYYFEERVDSTEKALFSGVEKSLQAFKDGEWDLNDITTANSTIAQLVDIIRKLPNIGDNLYSPLEQLADEFEKRSSAAYLRTLDEDGYAGEGKNDDQLTDEALKARDEYDTRARYYEQQNNNILRINEKLRTLNNFLRDPDNLAVQIINLLHSKALNKQVGYSGPSAA